MCPAEQDDSRSDPTLRTLIGERRALVGLAYRMLGSIAEAEDVVQETYTRWYAMSAQQREAIESPGAWLSKVASRISLDALGSARMRRERYVGEWIPEPLPGRSASLGERSGGRAADPADQVSLDESISMAFLVVLELMTPAERVAFILHDVFRYPFNEVAEVIGRTPVACRHLATSARRRLRATPLPAMPAGRRVELVRDFKHAWQSQDVRALVGLLDPDTVATSDGGGLVRAALEPIEGAVQAARAFADIARRVPDMVIGEHQVNGQPGLIAKQDGNTVVVIAFGFTAELIDRIWAVRNPEKLRHWPV